jgi:putative spermidine/putrescine transport system substrate-binding protein
MTAKATKRGLTRRAALGVTIAAAGSLAAPTVLRAQARKIVYATWGGSWETAMRKAWFTPFTQATGIDVQTVSGNTYGKLQAMVEARRTEWDVMEGLPELGRLGAAKGLLEPVDYTRVDRKSFLDRPGLVTDHVVPQQLFGRLLVYSKKLAKAPTGWADLFDTRTFPGKRALYNRPEGGPLEAALLADGVPADKLYPLDVDRAFRKLTTIRDQILFYETPGQAEQFLSDGQASMSLLADGRAHNIKNAGAPVEIEPRASLLTWSVLAVPKGAPNKDAAMEFLAYATSVKAQAAICMEYTYGPVVPKAWDLIPAERAQILSGGPSTQGQAIYQNAEWWGSNLEKVNEKFQAWKLG